MSDRRPYSRVYWTIVDDPKFAGIYDDDHHLAAWLRMLLVHDQAHPASGQIPSNCRTPSVKALVEAGLVDRTGGRFRIHGLDAERERRREAASNRTPPKREASGTQMGTEREASGSQGRGLAEDETRRGLAEPSNGRADALDAYWTVMGTYPNGRTKDWIQELVNEFDDQRVSAAIATESKGTRQGILSRVRDRLRSDADHALKAKAAAETKRLEAEAEAKHITPEQAAENQRRVRAELEKMIGAKP